MGAGVFYKAVSLAVSLLHFVIMPFYLLLFIIYKVFEMCIKLYLYEYICKDILCTAFRDLWETAEQQGVNAAFGWGSTNQNIECFQTQLPF